MALIPQERFGCLWGSPSPLRSPHPAAPSSEPGGPSAPRGRGTGSAGAPGAAVAARALMDGGGRRPPRLGVERRDGR